MAHKVALEFNTKVRVGFTDVDIIVEQDGKRLGTLKVSQGSIDWRPGSHRASFQMRWEKFDQMMADHGTRPRSRRSS